MSSGESGLRGGVQVRSVRGRGRGGGGRVELDIYPSPFSFFRSTSFVTHFVLPLSLPHLSLISPSPSPSLSPSLSPSPSPSQAHQDNTAAELALQMQVEQLSKQMMDLRRQLEEARKLNSQLLAGRGQSSAPQVEYHDPQRLRMQVILFMCVCL